MFGAVYSIEYLRLFSRWWFEDDPFLYFYAAKITNPFTIFTDPQVLRHFTTGQALVPMQILSYWIDVRLAGFSPHFAYAHQVCSFLLTLLLLYLVLLDELRNDNIAALFISVLWVLLPATAVVLQFLSTRHYMEGLLFTVLSLYLLQRLRYYDGRFRWLVLLAIPVSAVVALLYKEIYLPITPAILLLYALRYKERALALSTIVMVCGYMAYRFWMIGPALNYGMPYLKVPQYFAFLSKLPYTISSNYGGYCICGLVAVLCFYFARRGRQNLKTVLYFFAALVLSLAAVAPVSYALYGTIRVPDPWHRIVFLLHTIGILGGGYFAVYCATRRVQVTLALVVVVLLVPGTEKTRRLWVKMTESAEREGKFYLNNPDKVLLSEQVAWWFIPGVHAMYEVGKPHYVNVRDLGNYQIQPGSPVWRFQDGRFVPDYEPLKHVGQRTP